MTQDQELIADVIGALHGDREVNVSALKMARTKEAAAHCNRNIRALSLAIAALQSHDELVAACGSYYFYCEGNIESLIEKGFRVMTDDTIARMRELASRSRLENPSQEELLAWADELEFAYRQIIDLRTHAFATATERNQARAIIQKLQQWIDDCQSGMYINCVYCGHRYGPDDGNHLVTMRDALEAHISVCPSHPLSSAKAEISRLKVLLRELAGPEDDPGKDRL